jgi:hypothetical protein
VGVVADGSQLGEPQVRQHGAQVVAQEDVGRLEVAVDHRRRHHLVQVALAEAAGGADGHLDARVPAELIGLLALAAGGSGEEVRVQAAAREKLVDEEALLGLGAVAYQGHHVGVVEQHQHGALHHEFAAALRAAAAELLDGDLPNVVEAPPVDPAEAALADEVGAMEAARGGGQLRERELAGGVQEGGVLGGGAGAGVAVVGVGAAQARDEAADHWRRREENGEGWPWRSWPNK